MALRVYCALCFGVFQAGMGLLQGACGHVFCANCAKEVGSGCPFDGQVGVGGMLDLNTVRWVEWLVGNMSQASDPSLAQQLSAIFTSLSSSVCYAYVPCRKYYYSLPCAARCPYSHTQPSVLGTKPCPLAQVCFRGQLCPYNHTYSAQPQYQDAANTGYSQAAGIQPINSYQTYTASQLSTGSFPAPNPYQTVMPPPGQSPQAPKQVGMTPAQLNPGGLTPGQLGIQSQALAMPAFTAAPVQTYAPPQLGYQPGYAPQYTPPPVTQFAYLPSPPPAIVYMAAPPGYPPPPYAGREPHSAPRAPHSAPRAPPSPFQYHKPARWYDPTRPIPTATKQLSPTEKHYKEISSLFAKTSSQSIVSIEQIFSYRLYTNYAYKHEAFSRQEGTAVKIKHLFHGTSSTDPKVIYDSDTGLDSRVGRGMWGQGTYYAVNSSYSVNYSFTRPDGKKQMFCCSVIIGDAKDLPSTPNLIRPPQKPNSGSFYHSVKGNTQGSDIYITYEPAMSYPSYLITFG